MRCFLLECIAQKPTVADICADLIRRPPQRWQAVQMLDQHHFEQHNRVHAGPPGIFAVQWFHHFIEPVKIYCFIYFSQQMPLGNQALRIDNLYDTTIHFPRSSIFHHPEPFYHINAKKPSWAGLFRHAEHRKIYLSVLSTSADFPFKFIRKKVSLQLK